MKHPAIFLALCLCAFAAAAEPQKTVELPKLTKTQMLEDFDRMTEIVRDAFPADVVNKKVYGLDIFEKLKEYRAKIRGDETPVEFIETMTWAMFACKGSHLCPSDNLYSFKNDKRVDSFYKGYIADGSIDITHAYLNSLIATRLTPLLQRRTVQLLYQNGDYYNLFGFSCDNIEFKRNLKLVEVNGKPMATQLASVQDRLDRFDPLRHVFYATSFLNDSNFYIHLDYSGRTSQDFKFADENGKELSLSIANGTAMKQLDKPVRRTLASSLGKTVESFNGRGILYIRIPAMNEGDIPFYLEGMKKACLENVHAAILDVRCNQGGSDMVWTSILRMIISKDLTWKSSTAMKNTGLAKGYARQQNAVLKKFLKEQGFAQCEEPSDPLANWQLEKIDFLDGQEFLVGNEECRLSPDKDSLRLDVPIYVIAHDIYSSAGGLTSLAQCVDGITSVGTENPMVLGKGIDPLHVSLPNSKLIVAVETNLDLTGCKSAEDTLHTKMKVEVEMTAQEKIAYMTKDIGNIPLEELLVTHDPYFKKVLELINTQGK